MADVGGVNISGLILDAGPMNSPTLLTVGTQGSTVSHAADPVSIDDVFFRVGGAEAGSVTDAFIDNSNNSILDDIWSWRADHGAGAGSWTSDTAATGLTVNGNNVTAYGLAVEHYQQYETVWNGQGGTVIFYQNENPYDVPSQSAWMSSADPGRLPGVLHPQQRHHVPGYGMGSYSNFDVGPGHRERHGLPGAGHLRRRVPRRLHHLAQQLRRHRVGDQRNRRGRQLDRRGTEQRGHLQLILTRPALRPTTP